MASLPARHHSDSEHANQISEATSDSSGRECTWHVEPSVPGYAVAAIFQAVEDGAAWPRALQHAIIPLLDKGEGPAPLKKRRR